MLEAVKPAHPAGRRTSAETPRYARQGEARHKLRVLASAITDRVDDCVNWSEACFQPSAQTASRTASFVTASSSLMLLSSLPAPCFSHFPVPPPPGE